MTILSCMIIREMLKKIKALKMHLLEVQRSSNFTFIRVVPSAVMLSLAGLLAFLYGHHYAV